jgi:hypothetical protein
MDKKKVYTAQLAIIIIYSKIYKRAKKYVIEANRIFNGRITIRF